MENDNGESIQVDMSQYIVRARRQVMALLDAMYEKKNLLTMTINGSAESAATMILDIDSNAGTMTLDRIQDDVQTDLLLRHGSVELDSNLEHIKISFIGLNARSCMYDGSPAIKIDLPESVIRLQRREFYRVPTPIINPIMCKIAATNATPLLLPLKNISAGGLMLIDDHLHLSNEIGLLYKSCSIALPSVEPVLADLRVRNRHSFLQSNGHMAVRVGMQFEGLSPKGINAVQKYINKLEHDLRALKPD